jgi:aryl-alcohol dehydrogenase-like predicted oxidoreductase
MLTGKYRRGEEFPPDTRLAKVPHLRGVASEENFDYTEKLAAFAAERGHSLVELAVAWLLAQDGVASVIAGATSPKQVKANVAGAGWRLSAEDLAALPSR